jgi:hypothetical protein
MKTQHTTAEFDNDIKQFAIDKANDLKKLNPPQRDAYIHFMDPYITGDPSRIVEDLMGDLTRPQQEMFASLLPQWEGYMEDLIQVAKDLTP